MNLLKGGASVGYELSLSPSNGVDAQTHELARQISDAKQVLVDGDVNVECFRESQLSLKLV